MTYFSTEWATGDEALAEVKGSKEIASGTYRYKLVGHPRRWQLIGGFIESDLKCADYNRERYGTPHAVAESKASRLFSKMVRVLPDCPCCQTVKDD